MSFETQSCYVPCVIFRNSQLAEDGSVKWGCRTIQQSFKGTSYRDILRGTGDILAKFYILPLHTIHVEHCVDCEHHKMTTWHIPGSYEKKFDQIKKMFRETLPPSLILSNKYLESNNSNKPRIGSFEITLRPFLSNSTQLVYSKLTSKTIPDIEKLVADLACHLNPETIVFEKNHALEIHLFDSYKKKPIVGATISIYNVRFNSVIDDSTEDILFAKKPAKHIDKKESFNRKPFASQESLVSFASQKNSGMPAKRPISAPLTKKKHEEEFSTKILKSSAIEDAKFRHSIGYLRVRIWNKENVAQWFYSFGIAPEVVNEANLAGVVDGPSFLALSNIDNFERWGIRSKLKLLQLERALKDLLQENAEEKFAETTSFLEESAACTAAVLSSVPGRPNRSNESNYKLVLTKKSERKGLVLATLDCAGSYIIKIESPSIVPYTSTVFNINGPGHTAYCASLNPRLGLAKAVVKLDGLLSVQHADAFNNGLLVSLVNIQTGRRHIGHAMISHEENISAIAHSVAQRNVPLLNSRKARQSVGQLFVSGISAKLNRNVVRSAYTSTKEQQIIPTKDMICHIWLPLGRYYSEIDGAVFSIVESSASSYDHAPFVKNKLTQRVDDVESPCIVLSYREDKVWKCHNRLIMSSVRAFQKIYRRYKKEFLTENLWAYLTLKRGLKRSLNRCRLRIKARYLTKIQSWYRKIKMRLLYIDIVKKFKRLQKALHAAHIRRNLIRNFEMKKIVRRSLVRYHLRRKGRRQRAALKIQCAYRSHLALKIYSRYLFNLRVTKRIKIFLRGFRKRFKIMKQKKRELHENMIMNQEENYMRQFLIDEIAHARYMLELKIAAVLKRRHDMATKLESCCRGFMVRNARRKGILSLCRLQVSV